MKTKIEYIVKSPMKFEFEVEYDEEVLSTLITAIQWKLVKDPPTYRSLGWYIVEREPEVLEVRTYEYKYPSDGFTQEKEWLVMTIKYVPRWFPDKEKLVFNIVKQLLKEKIKLYTDWLRWVEKGEELLNEEE